MPICEERFIEYSLSDWLRKKRRELEVTQDAVGAAISVSKIQIYNYESCAQFPGTLGRLRDWAKAVGCSLEITMVDGDGERHNF